jgi:hypothetical protein
MGTEIGSRRFCISLVMSGLYLSFVFSSVICPFVLIYLWIFCDAELGQSNTEGAIFFKYLGMSIILNYMIQFLRFSNNYAKSESSSESQICVNDFLGRNLNKKSVCQLEMSQQQLAIGEIQ